MTLITWYYYDEQLLSVLNKVNRDGGSRREGEGKGKGVLSVPGEGGEGVEFPSNVTVTVITGYYYDEQLPSTLNKVP